jgi:hypothetical protein
VGEGSDIGEVLVAAQEIIPKDMESYANAFNMLADRVQVQANAIDAVKFPFSARKAYFRAASYYRSADFFLHGNWSDRRIDALLAKQTTAFNMALRLMGIPGQRYNLTSMDNQIQIPVIVYNSGIPGPRPTIIMCQGYDGSQEEMYHVMGKAALERGINVITYEGPGQPIVRRDQDLGFIYDWEKVTIPVVDFAVNHAGVDSQKIGLLGYSFGGYLAPRAASLDHRLAAVMAIDGVFNFGQDILASLGPQMRELFTSGKITKFNNAITKVLASPDTPTEAKWAFQQGQWSFKASTPYEFVNKSMAYDLAPIIKSIKAPVFVGDAENEHLFQGQAQELAKALGPLAHYHFFNATLGVGEHCAVGGSVLQNQVVLDWFEETSARAAIKQ